ncbi:hypothetical protein HMPREF0262_02011 [Clostridium sp. ATCC 29733]|nr:hypothetical protein HMPREF0262_02011 [Clostridium sp. ATCC 29733]
MRLARLPLCPLERTSGGRFGRARGSPISLSPPIPPRPAPSILALSPASAPAAAFPGHRPPTRG